MRRLPGPHEGDDARFDERLEPDRRRGADDSHLTGQFGLVEQTTGSQGCGPQETFKRVDIVDAELAREFALKVIGHECPQILARIASGVGVERGVAAPQKSLGQRQLGLGRGALGRGKPVDMHDARIGSEGFAGRALEQQRPPSHEHETGWGVRPRVEFAMHVVDEPGGQMHVVDHDRRRTGGKEGCGVELGAEGFAGERE